MKKSRTQKIYLNKIILKRFMQSILGVLLLCVTVTVQGQTGAIVVDSSNVGVNIQKTSGNGISILNAGSNGVNVTGSTNDGYSILLGGNNGFFAGITGADGLHVSSAGVYGVQIEDSGNDAIRIDDAGDDGLDVHGATGDGVYVTGVGRDGIFVNSDVGRYSTQIWGSKNLAETPIGHIAHLENRNLNSNADVLSLKVGRRTASAWPGSGNNFITFFNGDSVALGRVEGNGSGGVVYGTSGSDYAESLPQINASEKFFPGEIVGVHDGRISHVTKGAAQVMVVTDQPAVLGNSYDQQEGYKPVSFIGQIPVKVKGTVEAGDWIVPDGNHSRYRSCG